MNKNIYCIGGANIDCKLKLLSPLTMKTSNPVISVKQHGGVARNIADNLSRWTEGIYLQCLIGNDADGHSILQQLTGQGINIDACIMLDEQQTSRYFAVLNQQGELEFGLSDMQIYDCAITCEKLAESWTGWKNGGVILIDANLPLTIIDKAIQCAVQKHMQICIDPVSVNKITHIPDDLSGVFLIKPDRNEASALANISISSVEDGIKAGRIIMQRGVENVIVSLGENGYIIINNNMEKYIQIDRIDNVVDVSGAGDAFLAGILYGLQQHYSLNDACKLGANAAACTIQSIFTVANDLTAACLRSGFIEPCYTEEDNCAAIF